MNTFLKAFKIWKTVFYLARYVLLKIQVAVSLSRFDSLWYYIKSLGRKYAYIYEG